MNKYDKISIVSIILIVIFTILYYAVPAKKQNPHVNPKNGQYIPFVYEGTFRNTETGEIFTYTVKDDHVLEDCIAENCKEVYFFGDFNGILSQPVMPSAGYQKEEPMRGIVTHIDVHKPDIASYVLEYEYKNKKYTTEQTQNLCSYVKGEGAQCHIQPFSFSEGQPVLFYMSDADRLSLETDKNLSPYITNISGQNRIRSEVLNLKRVQ